jgi:hypothetical protein
MLGAMLRSTSWIVGLGLIAACGGTPSEGAVAPAGDEPAASGAPGSSADVGAAAKSAGEAQAAEGIPNSCGKTVDGMCLPAPKWVTKLCGGDYPTVALVLFRQGTPWTRGYVTQETKAWNASGGGSSPEKLKVDEEVIVLRKFSGQSPGGIEVSGASGGVDALRWDGMCVTLDAAEIRYDPPPRAKNARIIWSRIEHDVREQLKEHAVIYDTYVAFKKACRGITVGAVSKDCEKLDGKLSETIAEWVREHPEFPTPKRLPD